MAQLAQHVVDFIEHLSEKPWSDYTKADYTLEQWHAACLIHQHDGPPTSKDQCKLPVKTPNGAVNRNGVHAAAAALAGARTPINASADEKGKAAKTLIHYYHQMNETPPPSLLQHSDIENLLEHHGTKGMKWGQRKAEKRSAKADMKWQKNIYSIKGAVDIHNNVADKMNNGGLARLNAKYPNLSTNWGDAEHKRYFKAYEKMNEDFTAQAVKEVHGTSPSGKLTAKLDTSTPDQWKVTVTPVDATHAVEPVPTLVMEVEYDKFGRITLVKNVRGPVTQQGDVKTFIEHHGVKGMKWGVRGSGAKRTSSKSRTSFNKSPKRLTTHELEARIKRMEMEKKYNELNRRDVSKGSKVASEILGNSGKKVATTVLTGALLFAVKQAVKKKFGEEAASMVTKRGK